MKSILINATSHFQLYFAKLLSYSIVVQAIFQLNDKFTVFKIRSIFFF